MCSTTSWSILKQLDYSISISSLSASSLLRSRFLGCHTMLHPKRRLLTTEPHSFPFVFVVCLHFVEQTNHIIAKCEWCKISHVKASGFCFTPHARHQNWAVFVGYDHNGGKKKHLNQSPKYKGFMRSLLYVRLMREYVIFWKCLIVSANLKASYRLKTG